MRKLVFFLLTLTYQVSSYSIDFVGDYRLTIKCGPSNQNEFEQLKLQPFNFFVVETDSKGRFIIWTNNYQYPSFEEIKYHTIYNQIGGIVSAKVEKYGAIEKYYLIRKDKTYLETRIFMLDKSTMTFISRIDDAVPIMGICWYPSKN